MWTIRQRNKNVQHHFQRLCTRTPRGALWSAATNSLHRCRRGGHIAARCPFSSSRTLTGVLPKATRRFTTGKSLRARPPTGSTSPRETTQDLQRRPGRCWPGDERRSQRHRQAGGEAVGSCSGRVSGGGCRAERWWEAENKLRASYCSLFRA